MDFKEKVKYLLETNKYADRMKTKSNVIKNTKEQARLIELSKKTKIPIKTLKAGEQAISKFIIAKYNIGNIKIGPKDVQAFAESLNNVVNNYNTMAPTINGIIAKYAPIINHLAQQIVRG